MEGAAFLAFLALGSREDLSAGPCVEDYLEDIFLFAIDFLRENRVGSETDSDGALLWLTTGV